MASKFVNKELLIEAVRHFPCLYDTSKKEYKDEIVRENAWKKVCVEVLQKTYESKKELNEGRFTLIIILSWPTVHEFLNSINNNRFQTTVVNKDQIIRKEARFLVP